MELLLLGRRKIPGTCSGMPVLLLTLFHHILIGESVLALRCSFLCSLELLSIKYIVLILEVVKSMFEASHVAPFHFPITRFTLGVITSLGSGSNARPWSSRSSFGSRIVPLFFLVKDLSPLGCLLLCRGHLFVLEVKVATLLLSWSDPFLDWGSLLDLNFWNVLLLRLLVKVTSLLLHIYKFFMNITDLAMIQKESFAIDEILDGVQLIHHKVVSMLKLVVNCTDVLLQEIIFESIVSPLTKFKVHNTATNFEKILDDVLRFS